MKTYKYINAEVVAVIDEDGVSRMSMLASALPPGTVIEPADPPPAPDMIALRKAAYVAESDPLFFKWQRGENVSKEDWIAKVAEIKTRYPIADATE